MWENVPQVPLDIARIVGVRGVQQKSEQVVCLQMHIPAQSKSQVNSAATRRAQLPFYIHVHSIRAQPSSCLVCALHAQNVSGERGFHRLTYATATCLAPCRPGRSLSTPADVLGNFLEAQAKQRHLRYNAQGSDPVSLDVGPP